MTRRAIFLDRDGVINQTVVKNGKPYPPNDLKELLILPGVEKAFSLFKEAGFLIFVVTNQPDVAKGHQKREVVEEINKKLQYHLPIDEVFVCYHDDNDYCDCRKPRPGMIIKAAQKYQVELPESFLVGDRWKDINAGYQVKCTTFFIDYGYEEPKAYLANYIVHSLLEAAFKIIDIVEMKT